MSTPKYDAKCINVLFSELAYDKGYLLQPFRMYKPGDGWGLERPDYSEKLFRIDRTQHFRKSQNWKFKYKHIFLNNNI